MTQIEQAAMKTFPLPILYNEEQQKSKEYAEVWQIAKDNQFGFVRGAAWADEHPKKGLIDIDKACDAYCKVCGHYAHDVPTHICRHDCEYYSQFKKYMEEQQ